MEPWYRIDAAAAAAARELLHACCGSERWVARMMAGRPFGTRERLLGAARTEWFALERHDWLEAFAQHPRIGERSPSHPGLAATAALSAHEQRGASDASGEELTALADANRAYELKFGFIFIVCATGLSAATMLGQLRARLANAPEIELGIAAEEQARITALRLLGSG